MPASNSRALWRAGPATSITKLALVLIGALPEVLRSVAAAPTATTTAGGKRIEPSATARLVSWGLEQGGEWVSVLKKEHHPAPGSDEWYMKLGFSIFLVLIGGVFSGLTLGLMGLDQVNLQVLSTSGASSERDDAEKVLKLLERGRHWVLVCLLLSNVIVNESLPIFLDSILGGGLAAVVLSTALIVIFGEILPQSVCARHGLRVGAVCAPFVLGLMWIEAPIAWPTAKLLDWMLGESHGTLYKKAELKTFVSLHHQLAGGLNTDEATIISSVLELGEKKVQGIMTSLEDTYTLPVDTKLDQTAVDEILALGHSRIPIHAAGEDKRFVGMLIVKKLIAYDPSLATRIADFPLSVLPETGPDSSCLDALNYFQTGRSHILLVSNTPGIAGGAIGVVTLEDVIEEMIGEEIIDETDLYVDVGAKVKVIRGPAKRLATGKALAPLIAGIIERRRNQPSIDYGTSSNTKAIPAMLNQAQISDEPHPTTQAFDRVKRAGGLAAHRRQSILGSPNPQGSPKMGSTTALPELDQQQPTPNTLQPTEPRGFEVIEGERTPLLGSRRNTNEGAK